MADLNENDLIKPDSKLRSLWDQLQNGDITEKEYSEGVSKRSSEIMKETGYTNLGVGSAGYILPGGGQAVGKTVLSPYKEKGIYAADIITGDTSRDPYGRQSLNKTNDIAAKGTANYDPNATNLRTFYNESGKPLSPSQVAATETGKSFAAAGWDIGFGPGMIAPGIPADTSERDRYIQNKERNQSSSVTQAVTQAVQPVSIVAPNPTPPTPPPPPPPPPPVKTAPIDTILFNDNSVPIEIMTDLIFENIGGQEIISIVRNDLVNGQNVVYQPIKNLSLINQQYNPNNVLALQGTSDKYFENFIIKLSNKVPSEGNGPNGQNIYINEDTADIVLDLINLDQDEQAEFQFRIDGTIYEAEL